MGYCINMTDCAFVIKKENFKKALENLKKAFIRENMTTDDYVDEKEYLYFSWVDTKTVLNSESLRDALREIRYNPFYDRNGNIYKMEFTGEKYGDEKIFFKALAPYVENNSYLSFIGEDGATWTWNFKNGKVELNE